MTTCTLTGITWNHSRALPPLVATAQRYEELNPGVRIKWEKRSLHEFGHASLAQLADRFDLLVVDHPMMGAAAEALIDVRQGLDDEEHHRVGHLYIGPCLESYEYAGALFALPIDAAAPAASFRPDLLMQADLECPSNWNELLKLASLGKVRMPGFPADLFLNWMGLCVSHGSPCAIDQETLFQYDMALMSLEDLRNLASYMPPAIYDWNPITLYEAMASGNDFAYCPFAYTYSNYSRRGFGANLLKFANPVSTSQRLAMRTVLGGTGIAISRMCAARQDALRYCRFTASPDVQRDLYGPSGGQPAARAAWNDAMLDESTQGFFSSTRSSVETAYVRPRYRGYIALQESAGAYIAQYLQGYIRARDTIESIDRLYRESVREAAKTDGGKEARLHA